LGRSGSIDRILGRLTIKKLLNTLVNRWWLTLHIDVEVRELDSIIRVRIETRHSILNNSEILCLGILIFGSDEIADRWSEFLSCRNAKISCCRPYKGPHVPFRSVILGSLNPKLIEILQGLLVPCLFLKSCLEDKAQFLLIMERLPLSPNYHLPLLGAHVRILWLVESGCFSLIHPVGTDSLSLHHQIRVSLGGYLEDRTLDCWAVDLLRSAKLFVLAECKVWVPSLAVRAFISPHLRNNGLR
jgi:hypothetical protein